MFRWRVLALCLHGIEALPDWLLEEGFAGQVRIVNTSTYGRGLQAGVAYLRGDEILSVPLRHVFCSETLASLNIGRLLTDRVDLSSSDILAATLAAYASDPQREATMMRLLPNDLSHHPLFYDDDTWELADRLVSGGLLHSALDEVLQSWHRVSSVLNEISKTSLEAFESFEHDYRGSENGYRWAHAILRSRGHAVRLRTQEGEWRSTWGLVPLADMINRDPEPNVDCRTRYGSESWGLNGSFVCTALKQIEADEFLWTEYVSKPELRTSATFLREYGFVPAETPHDSLSWLPPGCSRLHCMVRLHDRLQLQQYFGEGSGNFVDEALKNTSLVMSAAKQPDLKLLAQHEKRLLLKIQRSEQPRALFERWRGQPDLKPAPDALPEALQLFEVLRSQEDLHTVAWDRAIWNAGQFLLSHWDDALAAEVLYSHHDFSPRLEQVFRKHRKEAMTKVTLRCAFAAQALLNNFSWPVDAEEHLALSSTSDSLVRAMFLPAKIMTSRCPRAEALQSEREWEEQESIEICPYWKVAEEPSIQELYSSHPYPSWRRFGFMASEKRKSIKRTLIAGVGTGKAVLAHLQHFNPEEIVAVDLSKRSLQVAARQLLALDIRNVVLWQCDLTTLQGQFDVIESVGVLHHLPEPAAGFAAMKRLLAPGGTLILGLYSRMARRSIPVIRDLAGDASYEQFRTWLTSTGTAALGREMTLEEARFREEFLSEFSISSRSTFEDLLLHPVEHVFELPQLEELLAAAGLKVTGVRIPPGSQGVADRWLPYFTPQRQEIDGWPSMPLLAFLHRIETEKEPLLFTNMYVLTAAHGSTDYLSDMSRWVAPDALEEVESLPLPFEPEWSKELLESAIRVLCSRILHHVNGTGRWASHAPGVAAWLEAKVALSPHAARIARSLQTEDAVEGYCAMLVSHFLA